MLKYVLDSINYAKRDYKMKQEFDIYALARAIEYDLDADKYEIFDALDSNIKQYQKEVQNLKMDNKEQARFYKYNLHFKYNVKPTAAYLRGLIRDISHFDKEMGDKFNKKLESLESNRVINSLDSIISNINTKKYQNIQSNPTNQLENLKSLHKEIMQKWKANIESNVKKWRKNEIKKAQNRLIKRMKEWLEAFKSCENSLDSMQEMGEMFSEIIMGTLRLGMQSKKTLKECLEIKTKRAKNRGKFGIDESGVSKIRQKDSKDSQNIQKISPKIEAETIMQHTIYKSLGISPKKNSSALCVGFSGGGLRNNGLDFASLLEFFQNDNIKKICDMLGKLQNASQNAKDSLSNTTNYKNHYITKYAKEEVSGLTLGRDLENMLPREALLLNDSDFNILFDMKYAENRLFCLEKQGFVGSEKAQDSENAEGDSKNKGPIILCIDTSASMQTLMNGITPEIIAKAITLYIVRRAMKQGRACFLINFSVDTNVLDLSPNMRSSGLAGLMKFLNQSFEGGTDCLPALEIGLQKCQSVGYKGADLLMISDFIFSESNINEIENLVKNKDKENKIYALYVGCLAPHNIKSDIFEREFIYNPENHNLESLSENLDFG